MKHSAKIAASDIVTRKTYAPPFDLNFFLERHRKHRRK